jgi:hypothetical protein
VYSGFDDVAFGQKKKPSAFATAHLLRSLRCFEGLTDKIQRSMYARWQAPIHGGNMTVNLPGQSCREVFCTRDSLS